MASSPSATAPVDVMAGQLEALSAVTSIEHVSLARGEITARVAVANPAWGMPDEVHDWLKGHPNVHIVDFKNITESGITLIMAVR